MAVRTLADLRREDEERKADAETGETAPLLRADTQSTGGSSAGSASSGSYAQRATALRVMELLFPFFRWRSLLLLISIADWVVYITTLALGSEMPLVPSRETLNWLVRAAAILVTFGANVPPLVAKGEVWRLLTATFLHANLLHVAFNVFFQLRMGFAIERRYGYLKFAALYAASAIYGNLLSAAAIFCGSLKVGASTAGVISHPAIADILMHVCSNSRWASWGAVSGLILSGFGMMGVEMAELALTWRRLQHRDRLIANIITFFLLMGLFAFTMNGGSIDQLGHLGGLLCGLSLGFLYNKDMTDKPSWWPFAFWAAIFSLVALPSSCLPVLFAVKRSCSL